MTSPYYDNLRKMTTQLEIQQENANVEYSEWVLKWQLIESDMMFNVPWKKLYERVGLGKWRDTIVRKSIDGRWSVAEKKFWAEYLRFVTEVYHYGGTLEELKRRITDQRIYNKSVKGGTL